MFIIRLVLAISLSMAVTAQRALEGLPQLRGVCSLIYIGEPAEPLGQDLNSMLQTEELAEMRIHFRTIQPTSSDYDRFLNGSNLERGSLWALVVNTDNGAQCLIQGSKLPAISDVQNALEKAGIRSPISVLRGFLRQHPDHLDAQMQLLKFLRETAEDRTCNALKLDRDSFIDHGLQRRLIGEFSLGIDTSRMEDKKLNPEQDISIWGPYAQELQALFSSGDWRLVSLPSTQGQIPVDICSPIMAQTYRRIVSRIEEHLEEHQSSPYLWQTYGWMNSIAKQNSLRVLAGRLVQVPDERSSLPMNPLSESVLSQLIQEELANEKIDWHFIADTLMSGWQKRRVFVSELAKAAEFDIQMDEGAGKDSAQAQAEIVWKDYIQTLLEALIRTGKIEEAETVILFTVKYKVFRGLQRKAAHLAQSLGRQDLQHKWLALDISEKTVPDIDDLEIYLFYDSINPLLITINDVEQLSRRQINATLRRGQMNNWRINYRHLEPELAEFLRQQENWPEDVVYWALYCHSKILAQGTGLPDMETILRELEISQIQTPASLMRRFVSDNPSRIDGKDSLLRELKRIAEQKTRDKFGLDADTDSAPTLTDEDDLAIWGEYTQLYRQLFPFFVERSRPHRLSWEANQDSSFSSRLFIHSPSMKMLASSMLPRIEACLLRQPTDEFLWGAWFSMSDLNHKRHFRDIIESLEPSPLDNPLSLPPTNLRWMLMRDYSTKANWEGIIDVQGWRWELLQDAPGRLSELDWSRDFSHLLEAYLRLDKTSDANELILVLSQSPAWPQIKQIAVELAEKCGKETLAEQWGKL
ncbi:MAG: hypothetical protein FWG12_07795 [Holophagaceae bacterium]|nr:hypothetical protein [Holophagaceae bacterium]